MKNYSKISISEEVRIELHDKLCLTGAEVSINTLPAGTSVPFVHAHKLNEEIYAILNGEGSVEIDGEKIAIKTGDWLRISPSAKRQFFAAHDKAIKYICIQVKADSLIGYTQSDAIRRNLLIQNKNKPIAHNLLSAYFLCSKVLKLFYKIK